MQRCVRSGVTHLTNPNLCFKPKYELWGQREFVIRMHAWSYYIPTGISRVAAAIQSGGIRHDYKQIFNTRRI